jgi:Cyclic nucleotide-binding domain
MTGNTESPMCTPDVQVGVTGSAIVARTWYGQVRSAFSRPHTALMPATPEPASISHPSQPVSSLLGSIPSLRFATPTRLRELADVTQRERVDVGETIVRQGEDGNDVFFIVDGVYEVLISHFGQQPDPVRYLSSGDSFGELGVLYDVPRTATVRCIEAGHILRIPGETFLDALDTGS